MSSFTPAELAARDAILQTHLIFGRYLDRDIVLKLVDLFKSGKMADYIKEERRTAVKDTTITDVSSMIYNLEKGNPTLLIDISKNGTKFIHLSIHLPAQFLPSNSSGIIHLYKDIYGIGLSTNQLRKIKARLYALIAVHVPPGKPNSLAFTIADGLTTPIAQGHQKYDPIIQQEMKVIIDVLNNIFDEEKPVFYIGKDADTMYTVHNEINKVLTNINAHNTHYTRKNKGVYLHPFINNKRISINSCNPRGTSRRFQTSNRTKTVRRNRLRTTQKAKTTSDVSEHK